MGKVLWGSCHGMNGTVGAKSSQVEPGNCLVCGDREGYR